MLVSCQIHTKDGLVWYLYWYLLKYTCTNRYKAIGIWYINGFVQYALFSYFVFLPGYLLKFYQKNYTSVGCFFFVLKKLKYFQVNEFLASQENTAKQKMSPEEVAMGFIQVANEAMCRPIRALTQVRQFMCLTAIC